MSDEDVIVFLRGQIGDFVGKMREAGSETQSFSSKAQGHFSQLASGR